MRVLHPVAVHFKGSGFYNTDYGKKKKGARNGGSGEGSGESKSSVDSSSSRLEVERVEAPTPKATTSD